ncbi:MAG: tetratricopeptide repeat protein, partial [Clostridiales bacterium]
LNRLGENEEALKLCDNIILNNNKAPSYYDLKATILSDLGQNYSAIYYIDKAINIDDKSQFLNNKSFILNKLNNYNLSLKFSKKAIKYNSSFDMAYVNKGFSLFKLQYPKKAIDSYNKALTINPNNDVAYYNKACALILMGEINKSVANINSAINLDSKNLIYLNKKAEILILKKDFKKAKSILNSALEINNRYPETFKNLSLLYYYKNDYKEALEEFEHAKSLSKDDFFYPDLKAKILSATNKDDEATKYCFEFLSEENPKSDLYNVLGEINFKNYNYIDAMLNFEKSIIEDKMNVEAYLNKSKLLFEKHNYNNCITFSKKALTLFPNNLEFIFLIGNSYSKLSEYEESIKTYTAALKNQYDDDENINYNIAKEYLNLNNLKQAQKYNNIVLSKNPNYAKSLNLKTLISSISDKKGDHINNFINDNYLYKNKVNNFNDNSALIENKADPSIKVVNKYLNNIKFPNDNFTKFVYSKNYIMLKKYNEIETIKPQLINENLYYLELDSFNFSTGVKVIEELEKIEFSSNKNLIIDLRNNSSALLNPVYDILDCLLPKCTTNYEIDIGGKITDIKSNPYFIKFNKIFVVLNNYSSSSSELLALSLKTNSPNVTILGKPTLGLWVGQKIYEDTDNGYYIYLPSLYWNIDSTIPQSNKVYPDINFESEHKYDLINKVNKLLTPQR